ncbi:double-strand break repair protein AddB [Acidiphilium sp. AL]|uniref:double-strand break repair protein AddB n=1 Tax=Acidiphilium sp. AL TaxID=2871704 RepID=UPI0021CB14D2|nr:double-strand break repair protein AddB [Acidiphilium sp. AL]MCU4158574.1 double-strand break repair protein AddB [Acidiphilium sp. AL]
MTPNIAAFPLAAQFLPALAHAWLDSAAAEGRDPADGLLILPTRRAARAAAAGFLAAHGKPLILPRITAIGAPDEASLGIAGGLDLPPAIPPEERRAILARLILGMAGRDGAPTRLAEALTLADDLALLIDAAEQAEIDLAETLPGIVAPDLAEHWQRTLDFLGIVTRAWPEILAARGAVDPARRLRLLLDTQVTFWRDNPPAQQVWLAGIAAGSPAVARLARVVAGLDQGRVILAGFDPDLSDAAWDALDSSPTHPQAGLRRLLTAMGARREEVASWPAKNAASRPNRIALLRRAFLPPAALAEWQTQFVELVEGMFRLDAADEQDEARAIALALRDALETPSRDAALVTPDRGLAVRVSAELARLGIRAEDSAGEPLAETPPAILLRLLATAQAAQYAPVPLLALLKHPLAAAGRSPAVCRGFARRLDILLRKHLPGPGFSALRYAAEAEKDAELAAFIAALQTLLRPLIDAGGVMTASPAALIGALIEAAEALTSTDEAPDGAKLWAGEAGSTLSDHLARQLASLDGLPDIAPSELPALFDTILGNARLRRTRARDANPRVAIWGIMEARLQTVDTLILGGMVEGVFPAEPDPGPWLSRPMRKAAGLPDDAGLIGEAAHDVTSLIATCDTVILSAPRRRGRAPAVPSRFLARIELVLRGAGRSLARHPAASWSAQLDQPAARIIRPRPAPRPPAEVRPMRYSISEITTLLADPYAIHASRIMRLTPLNPLDAETDTRLFGTIVHEGLRQAATDPVWAAAPDAEQKLAAAFGRELGKQRLRRALEAFWRVRLERIAGWIAAIERDRLAAHGPAETIATEIPGCWEFDGFLLRGRADRIERRADGIAIIDYKTGSPPDDRAIETGGAPQLPLEAVIAEAGGFGASCRGTVTELVYWKLSGGATEGETRAILKGDADRLRAVIDAARSEIPLLLARYADPATPFLDAPHPGRQTHDRPFAGISRRAEWEDSA